MTCGIPSAPAAFWKLPTGMLTGASGAAGIALINALGNIGGFVSPNLLRWLKNLIQSSGVGIYELAGIMVAGAILARGAKS